MAEVEISYKGSNIATMNASGTKTLLTEGKYLEDNVTVEYTRPAAPSGTKNISITANGVTTEDVTNYASAQITANVPNTYAAADEGKVVSNGALVAQTSATYTENDTYDTTLINEVTVNVSGGGGVATSFRVDNYLITSTKWTSPDSIPNLLASGGCVHMRFTLPVNTSTTNDCALLCFGNGALVSWSPGASTCGGYFLVSRNNSRVLNFHMRGGGADTALRLESFADENYLLDMKFYTNKYIDVNTETEYTYTTAQQKWMDVLATKSYISVGVNQSNPLVGALIDLFAVEAS